MSGLSSLLCKKNVIINNSRGQANQLFTTTKNKSTLFEPGSLFNVWDQIPRVIRDAIDFTDRIGERFLWVDSLCIMKDSPMKYAELRHMAGIYQNATATLMACIGENANHPLRTPIRITEPGYWTSTHPTDLDSRPDCGHIGIQRSKDRGQSLADIRSTFHNTRGWTYQERLLSRRKICFLPTTIVFHCHSDLFCPQGDQIVGVEREITIPPYLITEHDPRYLTQTSFEVEQMLEWPQGLGPESFDLGFLFWSRTMEEYSGKTLSFDDDILIACTAILQAIEARTHWTFVQALPVPLLELAILWIPTGPIRRRFMRESDTKGFSTWSWLAWCGSSISYRLALTDDEIHIFRSQISEVRLEQRHYAQAEDQDSATEHVLRLMERIRGLSIGGLYSKRRAKNHTKWDPKQLRALGVSDGCHTRQLGFEVPSHVLENYQGLSFDAAFIPGFKFDFKLCHATLVTEKSPEDESQNVTSWAPAPSASYEAESQGDVTLKVIALRISVRDRPTCGFIYGVSDEDIPQFQTTGCDDLDVVVLASCTRSAFKNGFDAFPAVSTAFSNTDESSCGVVNNIMLVRRCGQYAERVGVGEMVGQFVWKFAPDVERFRLI